MSNKNKTYNRRKVVVLFFFCAVTFLLLSVRLVDLMIFQSAYYTDKAVQLHERERSIKAARGRILDRNGVVLADNKTVCTISVIHSQIEDPEAVIAFLCGKLDLSEEFVRKRVEKYSSMERIRSNVPKELGDEIREADLPGVKVDEDYKRYYPYDALASKVLGFTGGDNQGIIGLEVIYDEVLSGEEGMILTLTDAAGIELEAASEHRKEPVPGNDLVISLDYNIQSYATQLAKQVMATKEADRVSLIVMNPQNGEIMAMVDVPEFNLNEPYTLTPEYELLRAKEEARKQAVEEAKKAKTPEGEEEKAQEKEPKETKTEEELKQEKLNGMWRNGCINDTYEPGSTFKVITAAAALETGCVTLADTFSCPGFIVVDDRKIRCHKVGGHGAEDFTKGICNSCNPVFVTLGMRVGAERYYDCLKQFGLLERTGVDLPGEAGTIMHQKDAIGNVELATMSFGQSFQITPLQLAATVSSLVNGGRRITPHLAVRAVDETGAQVESFEKEKGRQIVSAETSETLQMLLEKVVSEGGGSKAQIEGYSIGGKTATSQTLPRGSGRYIASFVGFSPADDPKVLALVVIHSPQGTYYGGQIAAPVIRQLFENVLPYLEK
ncbi:MAG: peptidoglycan glycosyltransferase [Lachnospiraceae bacterium]|jgi:stage V sporulation protein D (sporulation-specific penicillin-binding protein)|nr:peptidoglycan glycosyltransferase [Lachnospiraceae bacterium]